MTADEETKRRRRDFIKFVGMAYGVLGLIAVQLWLRFSGHPTVSAIFGIPVLAGVVFAFWWGYRRDLWHRLRKGRGQSSP